MKKFNKVLKQEKKKKETSELARKIKERALAQQSADAKAPAVDSATINTSSSVKNDSVALDVSPNSDKNATSTPKIDSDKPTDTKTDTMTFFDFELVPELVESCHKLNFKTPTPIQQEAIPWALKGKDIIGLAQTGSGKTAAFALPVLQALWEQQTPYFACVLAPTRELAFQIKETFDALGAGMGCKTVCVTGGMSMMDQARDLMKKPHVIVATPGRLLDHLQHTKGFSLRKLQYFIMDEADRLLELEFGPALDSILELIPKQRHTFLFSATMTDKINKLQRASLKDPVKCAVSDKYSTVDSLVQSFMLTPDGYKNTFLIYLLNKYTGKSVIIFTRTIAHCQRTAFLGRILGFPIVPLHGQLTQSKRLGALNKFKSGQTNILVATDVAARGLDIPSVDIVINYDMPTDSKTYIHRVGRTARAGNSGISVSLVSQYEIEILIRLEKVLGFKITREYPDKSETNQLRISMDKAEAKAIEMMKEFSQNQKRNGGGGRRRDRDGNDREEV